MAHITDFFKSTKSNEISPQKEIIPSVSKVFYQYCLAEQINLCKKTDCIERKLALQTQIGELKDKCKNAEDAVKTCKIVLVEKDLEIEQLRLRLQANVDTTRDSNQTHLDSNSVVVNSNSTDRKIAQKEPTAKKSISTVSFSKFCDDLSSDVLADLRSIGMNIREDSKFISTIIKGVYADRLDVLKGKSVLGRGRLKEKNSKVTPKKYDLLTGLFDERLKKIDEPERTMRFKRLNKLIKDSMNNISKRIDQQNLEMETCRRMILTEQETQT